ncbi:MAG: TonB-dependent receptor plug domain-containing protein, partial [Alphaproteobacteria bacterium]|nr:TonB-dependent receptor plug domain-containing protein [Alphaproteobacteria bacterium]
MNYITKLLGMSALAAGLIPAAYAQEAEQDKEAVLGTVVVTAQFTEQNLQDTPIAITGFSGDMLDTRGMSNVLDISAQSPNVTLTPGGAFSGPSLVAFIRGVGQTDFNPALEPGVGMYVDDVYYATLTGSVLDLLDLNRVEILRGPQGTLAGKNSIGGSIKLFSEQPSDDPNGYVEVAYGDYDALKLRAASNFTLIEDKLWARVSGVSNSRSGYVDTYSYGCLFPGSGFPNQRLDAGCKTGADGDIDYSAARAALRWLASDTVEVNASVDFTDDNSGATANTLLGFGPTVAPVIVNGQLQWPTVAAVPFTPLDPSQFLATDPYVSYADYTDPRTGLVVPRDRIMQSTGASLSVDWALSDTLQLQSISGYRQYDSSFAGDYDASPVPVAILYQTNTHEQYSQEVRLNGQVGDFAEWTVGGFYFKADTDLTGRIDLGYVGFDFIHGPDPVETTNWALFGNGIFHLTDQLVLS